MLAEWTRDQVNRLYRNWAGPDPHSRPQGLLFQTLSTTWRTSRSLYHRWWRSQQPILLQLDGPPRLTGCGSITGWVLSRSSPIATVQAFVAGKLLAQTTPDHVRNDAHAAYPYYPTEYHNGFRLCPQPGVLSDGQHPLVVKATNTSGEKITTESTLTIDRFTLADDPGIAPDLIGTDREYQLWLRSHDHHDLPECPHGPLISIVMPVFRPRLDHWHQAIESVKAQSYERWELCLCDDGSANPHLSEELACLAASDARIKVTTLPVNQGIASATNHAVRQSNGQFIAFLDQDDWLHRQALQAVALHTQHSPADLYYTDEDRLDLNGRRKQPFFKPAWSPDLLHTMMYLGHLCVYRRSALDQSGLCDSHYDGTQDWELALRVTDQPGCRVQHIPGIFYHWREGGHSARQLTNQRCHERGRQAVEASLFRRERRHRVEDGPRPCTFSTSPSAEQPRVSILIPTKDQPRLLERCLGSLHSRTDYPDFEIIVIDNGSSRPETVEYLRHCAADQVLRIDAPFNHSDLNNQAARVATGQFLVLLNDDTEILSRDWLAAMVEQAHCPEVGAVGAWLLYPDGRTQHTGIVLEYNAVARPLASALMLDGLDRGTSLLVRDVSAVTGACLLVRRQLYLDMNGLDSTTFPTSYNDVDFCLRLREKGYRIILNPQARLIHHESLTRRVDPRDEEYRHAMRERWSQELKSEWFYNSNLSQSADWHKGLAFHWQQ